MRKFFILTLLVASLMMVSCVERRNRVILEKFIPISEEDDCSVKINNDTFKTEGLIDLAFTSDYLLAFQITNHIPSSDGGGSEASLTTAEANYFYSDTVEIEYEWNPEKQADGRQLTLEQDLWNKKTRKMEYPIVVSPNEGQAAGYVHVFEEVQAKNLLEHVGDIDWIASPLIIKLRVIGELADGTKVETNQMNFNIRPTFGATIQQGSVYYIPEGGFQAEGNKSAEKVEYDAITNQCAFAESIVGGCFYGQDSSLVNCYGGDTPWERYIAETKCNLTNESCYHPGNGAAGVVEIIFNTNKKPQGDGGYYACCPPKAPEAPEEKEDEQNQSGSGSGE